MVPADGVARGSAIEEFERLLDKKGLVRLLDVFLANREIPVSTQGLIEFTRDSQPTVSRRTDDLIEIGIIEESEGSSPKMFRLNMEHPAASGLLSAYEALHEHVDEIQESSEEFEPESYDFDSGSPFVELFRYPTNGAILSALLHYPDAKLSKRDIAEIADVDSTTVGDNIPILVRIGIATREGEDSRNPKYSLDREHPAADGFLEAIAKLQVAKGPMIPTESEAHEASEQEVISSLHEQLREVMSAFGVQPEEADGAAATQASSRADTRASAEEPDQAFCYEDQRLRFEQRADSVPRTAA
ncbi:hypothetical protein [Haloarcula sp. K1]|uniref:hypothetical protein n=1 Tax=Haloarcula sp. K1 TaxID=1622207 RepID=UPI0007BC0C73|nr:hypothetical protein [Haloarcula sp. K1]KZX49603.1 hypothetical protein AV929_20220 [Haloarcula sp. K1]